MISITCSGAVFSYHLYENIKRGRIQEGFLLGNTEKVTSQSISDSNICFEDTVTSINVFSFLPCSSLGSFYSGAGRLNEEKLKKILGPNLKSVVGWYRCRGNNDDLYLREIRVHKQLQEFFELAEGNFVLGLFSTSACGKYGTMVLDYKFGLVRNRGFEGISLELVNMKDSSTEHYLQSDPYGPLYQSSSCQSAITTIRMGARELSTISREGGKLDQYLYIC